jgi:hypothetical protein
MRRGAERKSGYRFYRDAGMAGIFVFAALMLLFAFVATPKGKRWTAPANAAQPLAASSAPVPALSTIHWLKRDPKTERAVTIALYASYFVPMVMAAAFIALFQVIDPATGGKSTPEALEAYEKLKQSLLVMSVLVGGLPVIITLTVTSLRCRLGTDGRRLYVKRGDGRQESFAPEQLVYSVRAIACRDRSFAVQNGKGQSLYAKGEVETFIAPLLRQATKLGPFEMLRYQLAHRNLAALSLVVYVVLVAALLAVTGLWKKMLLPR